jgi:hypothetical protein
MSKMNGLRAMREARYERSLTQAPLRGEARPHVKPTPSVEDAEQATPPPAEPVDALCGHRAISGRTCTRERGHEAKSHRYS